MNVNTIPLKMFDGDKGFAKLILYSLLTITIPSFVTYKLASANNSVVENNVECNNYKPDEKDTLDKINGSVKAYSNCEPKNISSFSTDWDTKRYSKKGDKYCASKFAAYPFPDLPFKSAIAYGSDGLKFSYINTVDDGSNPLVISLGNNGVDIRFFIQEINPQMIGVEKLNDGLERIDPITLNDIPKMNTEIEIQVRGSINTGNEVTYMLNINYISSLTSQKNEQSFDYRVKTTDTNPSTFSVNIASNRGSCIKPTGYEVCN